MAGSKSDYLENAILNHILGGVSHAFAALAHVYVALYSVAPTDALAGTELVGNGYDRVELDNDHVTWADAAGGSKHNDIAITFPTASGDWLEAVAWAILDSAVGGTDNILYWGDLTVHKTVLSGDTAEFAIGDLVITED